MGNRMTFNWTCPHCNRAQTVTGENHESWHNHIDLNALAEGSIGISVGAIKCANPDCLRLALELRVGADYKSQAAGYATWHRKQDGAVLFESRVYPRGAAKPQPDYIPKAIREDYEEACLIRDDSPKASATLARRCLQGIIRDFCGISKARLIDEIKELRQAVDDGNAPKGVTDETVDAIDHVRGIGNIGAHMEKDIDLIVSVDPGEAQALIELIEMLFEEWYRARDARKKRLARIAEIGADKKSMKAAGAGAAAAPTAAAESMPSVPEDDSGPAAA